MMKLWIPGLVFSLSVVSLMGLNGCDRQDPPRRRCTNCRSFLTQRLVGWPGARPTRPRKLRQRWERQTIGQSRPVRKGRRKPEMLNVWTLWMSSSLHATIQLVQWRNYICE